jgi:hypothetical protein
VRQTRLPGGRQDIRERATTLALHLLRRVLLGESDAHGGGVAPEQRRESDARD